MKADGTLFGVGVGPGDPELITLKALRILESAPVVAYPAPSEGESMARAIVARYLPGTQEEIAIRMPLDAARFPADDIYDAAAQEISAHLEAGRDVPDKERTQHEGQARAHDDQKMATRPVGDARTLQ